ncbi:MAG: dTDP-4-dehydrorhamnose reductase [Methanomassiliicoccales archaeon]|nr:dTDP-4-dehydrorhamnose reductase [Methanomassiliicoccales archaeon]
MDIHYFVRRIAVVGAGGLLGQYVAAKALGKGYQVLGTFHDTSIPPSGIEAARLDITDADEARQVLRGFGPEAVILASALTNVDFCERNPSKAWAVNAEGTLNIAQACDLVGARLLYLSTDYVFNGEKGSPYLEFESPDPLSIYARTKLEGERLTMDASTKNVVCRVSVLYGWNRLSQKQNFVTWVIDSLRKGKEVQLFRDQTVSPTYVPHCADVLLGLLESNARGIFHTSGPDCASRYDIGMKIAEVFQLDASLIKSAMTDESKLVARRPACSCLDVGKAEGELNMKMLSVEEGLRDMRSTEGKK